MQFNRRMHDDGESARWCRARRGLAVVLAFAGVIGASFIEARAQPLLDLGAPPGPPAPGQGAAALAEANRLGIEAGLVGRAGDPAGAVKAGLRTLARTLLLTGESAGQAGSGRIVLGYTAARRMRELDAATNVIAGPLAPVELALIEADLRAAVASLTDPAIDPRHALRRALAGLVPTFAAARSEANAAAMERLREIPGIDQATIGAAAALFEVCDSTASAPAFAASTAALAALLTSSIEAMHRLVSGVPEPRRERAISAFGSAFRRLAVDPAARPARESLAHLLAQDRLHRAALTAVPGPLRRALESVLERTQTVSNVEAFAPVPTNVLRVLEVVERGDGPDDESLPRQFRPAAKLFRQVLRATDAGLANALGAPSEMDPSLATAVVARRAALADVDTLRRSADSIRAGGEAIRPEWSGAADSVLQITQAVAKSPSTTDALVPLRARLSEIARFAVLTGEESLRDEANRAANHAAWRVACGCDSVVLLGRIEAARRRWLVSLDPRDRMPDDSAAATELAALAELMSLLADIAVLIDAERGFGYSEAAMSLRDTGEWEVRPATLAAFGPVVLEIASEASRATLDGRTEDARAAIARARDAAALVCLVGRLARLKSTRTAAATATVTSSPMWRELVGVGESSPSLQAGLIEHLATICRYAEEAAQRRASGKPDAALEQWLNARALEAFARIKDE
ncbi:MAG: hypothetical protein ACKVW3_08815 [Phycisphaerales bacterium]